MKYFHAVFPPFNVERQLHINALELLSVLVGLRLWAPLSQGQGVQIYCDNQTSVQVLNSGRSKDEYLCVCLRDIAFICAVNRLELRALHIEGASNRLSDFLSRSHLQSDNLARFLLEVGQSMQFTSAADSVFHLTDAW